MRKLLILVVLFSFGRVYAQFISTADCKDAIGIRGYYYTPPNFYPQQDSIHNEINPAFSCLSGGEINGCWFTFTTVDSGVLSFDIIPYALSDFDFALFDLSDSGCTAINNDASMEMRCNYSNSQTNGAITGANDGLNNQDEPTLNVGPGRTFALYISNYSADGVGFSINMLNSTCTFDQAIGIEENSLSSQIKIGPNPTNGLLNLAINPGIVNEITSLKLVDLTGKTLLSQSSGFSSNMSFDISNSPVGLYFLQITSASQTHSFKLLKQ